MSNVSWTPPNTAVRTNGATIVYHPGLHKVGILLIAEGEQILTLFDAEQFHDCETIRQLPAKLPAVSHYDGTVVLNGTMPHQMCPPIQAPHPDICSMATGQRPVVNAFVDNEILKDHIIEVSMTSGGSLLVWTKTRTFGLIVGGQGATERGDHAIGQRLYLGGLNNSGDYRYYQGCIELSNR